MPKDFGVLPAPCDFGAVVAEASAGVVSFLGTFALASKSFAAAGGAAGGLATGTEAGTPIKAAFFCAGSSVVALATGLGNQLLEVVLKAVLVSWLFLALLSEMLSGLLLLEEARPLHGCEHTLEVSARQSVGEA